MYLRGRDVVAQIKTYILLYPKPNLNPNLRRDPNPDPNQLLTLTNP